MCPRGEDSAGEPGWKRSVDLGWVRSSACVCGCWGPGNHMEQWVWEQGVMCYAMGTVY